MNAPRAKAHSISNILGTALLLSGALFCYLRIAAATQQLVRYYGSDVLGMLPATGLAAARALQNLAFGQISPLTTLLHFLLSCWPIAILFLGTLFLRKSLFAALTMPASAHQTSASLIRGQQGVRE